VFYYGESRSIQLKISSEIKTAKRRFKKMAKTSLQILMVLSVLMSTCLASANSRVGDEFKFAVSCRKNVATVNIGRGGASGIPVEFIRGNAKKMAHYDVKKTESDDLRFEYYNGPGFYMVVDAEKARAVLTAKVDGQVIKITDMGCSFHEFLPHPGITMGN
jgi:hypothetical protein